MYHCNIICTQSDKGQNTKYDLSKLLINFMLIKYDVSKLLTLMCY